MYQLLSVIPVVTLLAMVPVVVSLKNQVSRLSINPNFGCLTRTALEMRLERRNKVKSGRMSIIGWDVSGMGLANSKHGEEWVNTRIRTALHLVMDNLRKGDNVGQLNSGDEFIAVVPTEDVAGVIAKITEVFNIYTLRVDNKPSIYISSNVYDSNIPFKENAAQVMDKVYIIKNVMKGIN